MPRDALADSFSGVRRDLQPQAAIASGGDQRRSQTVPGKLVHGRRQTENLGGVVTVGRHYPLDPGHPQWGFQQLTAVVRAHRGHRLGLLVKTAMLDMLADAEPQLEWIATGNAAENAHMIAVNERLGYEVVPPSWNTYELPVGAALTAGVRSNGANQAQS